LIAGGLGAAALVATAPAAQASTEAARPTIVLVHGAFADSSSWTGVVTRLQERGYPVLAVANPLRGLTVDTAYTASVLASVPGPIVLVGHSYGGFVMTNAAVGNANVKALVYIAAFAPDEGESIASIGARFPGSLLGPDTLDLRYYPLADGSYSAEAYIKPASFREVFAGDLPVSTAAAMAATQRPLDAHALEQTSGTPAWRT
jgi:pimeloyl-ACP methyl ester carboxylesterase